MCKCYNSENVESEDFLYLRDHATEENTESESWTIILLWHYLLCDNKFLKQRSVIS